MNLSHNFAQIVKQRQCWKRLKRTLDQAAPMQWTWVEFILHIKKPLKVFSKDRFRDFQTGLVLQMPQFVTKRYMKNLMAMSSYVAYCRFWFSNENIFEKYTEIYWMFMIMEFMKDSNSHVYHEFNRPSLENRHNLFGVPLKSALSSLYLIVYWLSYILFASYGCET